MDDKVFIVTYDATNDYSYSEDNYGFSDMFGVFASATMAYIKVYEFINELKALVEAKGFVYNISEETYEEGHSKRIEFGISGARDCDISGFIFYICETELDHVETKIENLNCLNWLRNKEEK